MTHYDLCLAWNWEHDGDFVALLVAACQQHGLSLLQVTPEGLAPTQRALAAGEVSFGALLDRASDSDPSFLCLVEWARLRGARRLNRYEMARRAWDKAAMHLEFVQAGLHVPYALILPPHNDVPDLPPLDLAPFGPSFSIKPACRGGGEGVVMQATRWEHVLQARQEYPTDGYILQSHTVPVRLEGRPAWFRVLFCCGQASPCWWDTQTHVYARVSSDGEAAAALPGLEDAALRIAAVCGLELFSTEMALTATGHLVIVDYVNDPVDLRLQSKAEDGVPDGIVRSIADLVAAWVATAPSPPSPLPKPGEG